METIIKFAKVRPDAIIPTKREEDAGFDVYANFEKDYMIIFPHETIMIPTGIAGACDSSYCFIAKERGSTGTKGLAQRCGVIDSGYRNEIFIPITNTGKTAVFILKDGVTLKDAALDYITNHPNRPSNTPPRTSSFWDRFIDEKEFLVYPYEKAIAQLLVVPVPSVAVEEITYDELKTIPSERGTGCLGSSGK